MCRFFVIALFVFLYYRLDGAWFEKTRVASQFKDQYMAMYEHCKVTGVYVYPKKKEHHYRIEVSSKWDEWTSYCSAEPAKITKCIKAENLKTYLQEGDKCTEYSVKCQCPRGHRDAQKGDFYLPQIDSLGRERLLGDVDDLAKKGHRCAERCLGHRVDAGSANECVSGYFGPDGKLEVDWGTLRPISMQ